LSYRPHPDGTASSYTGRHADRNIAQTATRKHWRRRGATGCPPAKCGEGLAARRPRPL